MNRELRLETLAVHAGAEPDAATGAVTPPIHLSTTFERDPDGSYPKGFVYSRTDNPNRRALEAALAALEGGEAAACFASGSAAVASVLRTLRPGDHVLAPDDLYHGVRKLLQQVFVPWGLAVSFADLSDTAAAARALRPNTRLIWVETPSNPLLKLTDIGALAALARDVGALLVCDATWTPPPVTRALTLGAHLVVHSTTKYLAGHSDVLGGAVVAARADGTFERLRAVQNLEGAVPSPFDCWLVLRSLRTLPYRMRAHCDNAARVAAFLAGHARVASVHYPGLASHPAHALAARQMAYPGGMLSFRVRGGEAAAMAVAARVRLFTRGTSLGGVESLIEHRASIEGPESTTPRDLLRVSVGLEHPDDLIEDLEQAMAEDLT
ncbi:trans-sulfuration enzyme family protein [Truepera radiovictrix]|uniref:Cys/Met metabolism pyridoxal-phosphate-dependent protein n=1 Tax=Truepera radiovictrix (strain DSM 17093 / CIP 108686 / LMG 22925 / RQ-24) TaxID=649638 RepID=D7CXA5_TRURR|nr:aminotransferase class I/II-fold pyridoxal phosphate-dependent enzyme [Truepera radiovictrix]ADI13229.1 Cys/Met metabolism pyridoxal-phosphate-dependent protein [Truepera radiovictrix DSM 17093]WMT58207.1 aminotransferase class I/II-fold pyridoxal phosphate-dependent enzyme [Truepera radiovictrix]